MSEETRNVDSDADRREFVKKAGRLALLAPAVTFLLSTSLNSEAIASSGGAPHGTPGARRPQRRRRNARSKRH